MTHAPHPWLAPGEKVAGSSSNPWRPHTVRIDRIQPEVEEVATYELAFVDESIRTSYRFVPGQFNMLYLPGAGEIAISISDSPYRRGQFAHTIRAAGNVTGTLQRMKAGETLGLRGPFGTGWPLGECAGRDVVLVAGGIGLAPLRPVIYAMIGDRRQFGRIHLLFGARTPDSLLYSDEFEIWKEHGIEVQTTVDRASTSTSTSSSLTNATSSPHASRRSEGEGWAGNVGVVTLLLERLRPLEPSNTVVLCCGPEVMMRFTVRTALQRGFSPQQIWISTERNMRCAIGLCGHCQLGPEFICKDGPVFRYDRIAPFIDVEGF